MLTEKCAERLKRLFLRSPLRNSVLEGRSRGLWRRSCHAGILSVNAFHEKAGGSQVDLFVFFIRRVFCICGSLCPAFLRPGCSPR
jgi:hypothetical protein